MSLDPSQELRERYGDQLRAKISSKFSASTFLAGFAGSILSGLLSSLGSPTSPRPLYLPQVLSLTVAGTVLFVLAVIRLDELSMPKRFWPSDPEASNRASDVGLLTDDDLWILKDRMVYYWRFLTLLGTSLTGVAFLVYLITPASVTAGPAKIPTLVWALIGAVAAFLWTKILDWRVPHRRQLTRPVD